MNTFISVAEKLCSLITFSVSLFNQFCNSCPEKQFAARETYKNDPNVKSTVTRIITAVFLLDAVAVN
jgi:hypothetical protein